MATSRLVKMKDIPKWIHQNYGIKEPTRQTVYNWRVNGKRGKKLRCVQKFGQLYVFERILHEFAAHIS